MTDHTPGPWSLEWDEEDQNFMCIHGKAWSALAKVPVRMRGEQFDTSVGVANARLIAAAPDLLAAISDILDLAESETECLQELGRDDADTAASASDALARIEIARAAISKATGEK